MTGGQIGTRRAQPVQGIGADLVAIGLARGQDEVRAAMAGIMPQAGKGPRRDRVVEIAADRAQLLAQGGIGGRVRLDLAKRLVVEPGCRCGMSAGQAPGRQGQQDKGQEQDRQGKPRREKGRQTRRRAPRCWETRLQWPVA